MKKKMLIIVIILLIIIEIVMLFVLKSYHKESDYERINLDIDSELIQELYQMANPSEHSILLNDLYGNESLTNNYIIAIGIADYLKDNEATVLENSDYVLSYILEEDVDKHIEFVLGDVDYIPQDVYLMADEICGFDYNEELKRYENKGGCGDDGNELYYREVSAAYQEGINIYIEEKSFYVYNDWDEHISKVSVFDNYDKQSILDYFEQDSSEMLEIDKDKYIDNGSVYQYVFEKKDNNNYIFKGVKRI